MSKLSARIGAFCAPVFVSACAYTDVGPGFVEAVPTLDARHFDCCVETEKFYPEGPIKTVFSMADQHGPAVTDHMYGHYKEEGFPGTLAGNTAAEAALLSQLRPLDVVLSANKSYLWGNLLPGRFTHDVIYLGTEAQLRAAGLWSAPAVAALHDDIRAGRIFAEALPPKTQTLSAKRVMQVDGLAIVRPRLSTAERRAAVTRIAEAMGTPYDYTFDVATTDKLACTELLHMAMPGLGLEPVEAYGRMVIFPDQIVSQAIRGEHMELVGYMVGTEDGYAWRNTHSLMGDIAAYWGIPGSKS